MVFFLGEKEACEQTMSIISDHAKKMMEDVVPGPESDLEERAVEDDDDDDVSERPLVIQSPRHSETFDSPPAVEGTAASSIELLPTRTTTAISSSPSLSERSPGLTRMLDVSLNSFGVNA